MRLSCGRYVLTFACRVSAQIVLLTLTLTLTLTHTRRNVLRMLHAALPASDGGKGGEARSGTWWLTQAGGFHVAVCAAAAEAEAQLERLSDRSWGALHPAVFKHPITAG